MADDTGVVAPLTKRLRVQATLSRNRFPSAWADLVSVGNLMSPAWFSIRGIAGFLVSTRAASSSSAPIRRSRHVLQQPPPHRHAPHPPLHANHTRPPASADGLTARQSSPHSGYN